MTRLRSSLRVRMLAVGAACLGLGVTLFLGMVVESTRGLLAGIVHRFVEQLYIHQDGLGCPADPSRWALEMADGARMDAYDVHTLRSENPAAEPLTDVEIEALQGDARYYLSRYPVVRGEGRLLMVVAPEGPCSLLRLSWWPSKADRLGRLGGMGAMVLGAMLGAVVLGFIWVVRPLLQRIDTLAGLAREVGTEGPLPWPEAPRDELGVVAQALEQAHGRIRADTEALASRNEALRRHIADVSHDLRTPIASLQLALEQLRGQQPEVPEALAQALADAVYLETLTDNLSLAVTLREGLERAGRGQAELGALVERVGGRLRLLAAAKGVALEVSRPDGPVAVDADPVMVERALGNLVHNAVRYGAPGGHVAVVLERVGAGFSLRVLDDGPGVPPEALPRLTDRAWRGGDARQRDATGQGLGLAITAEVCAQAGFTLRFSALEPRGLQAEITGSTAGVPG
ncbi:MAG: HAMP domain-containing histidine kinase [Alphaproteobacteria bacterium]|nr:HAMP domain-containing histidine kinase [Alphaproteobacteria bacterium]